MAHRATKHIVECLSEAFIKTTSDYLVVDRLVRPTRLITMEYYIRMHEQDYQQASIKIQKSMDLHNIIGGDYYGA